MKQYPLRLRPAIKDYLWGGRRLIERYGKETTLARAAECWEVSGHPDGPSVIGDGPLAGQTLAEALAAFPAWKGTLCGDGPFPILIKLIDAERELSIQVHPADEYAWRVENQPGKNEMWYVLDADPGASLLLGFQRPVAHEEIRQRIGDNTLLEILRKVPVEAGDCYCIPAGLVHAIGSGVRVAEVQQSSNVTYRVYDYDRRGPDGQPRQLHIEKALEVIDPALQAEKRTPPLLADWPYFRAQLLEGDSTLHCDGESFHALLALEPTSLGWEAGQVPLAAGESVFLPAGLGGCTVSGCVLLSRM